jgi:ATP-dependent Clp protease ATP-binding subunit ClpA
MFEGFEDNALRTIAFAQKESHRLGQNHVGTEHILLGLIGAGQEIASVALKDFGVNLYDARREVKKITGRGWHTAAGDLPFTARATRLVAQLSRDEATRLDERTVSAEHLLLALLRLETGTGYRVLKALNVNPTALRERTLDKIAARRDTTPPVKQVPKLEEAGIFDRFGAEALQVVMIAQDIARKESLPLIDVNALLYGLLSQRNSKAADIVLRNIHCSFEGVNWKFKIRASPRVALPTQEIPFSEQTIKILKYARRVATHVNAPSVTPEHLLFALVCWSDLVSEIIVDSNGDMQAIEKEIAAELDLNRSYFPAINAESGKKRDPKSIYEWFNDDSIRIVRHASELARARKSSLITAHDLHRALRNQITVITPEMMAKIRPSLQKTKGSESTVKLSQEVLSIFVEAQKASGTSPIEPKHLLFGFLTLAKDGKIAGQPSLPSETWQSLRNTIITSDYPERKSVTVLPLEVDEHTIRITSRLQRTLVNAKNYMKQACVGKIGVNHLVLALLDEASNSEVEFVKNREKEFNMARTDIRNLKSDRRVSRELIKDILDRALVNAKRLGSLRLDINHLALSLLDENHAAVNVMLVAVARDITSEKARKVIKLRLDQCLIYQSGHPHQIEPGEILDLSDIYGSI